MFVVSVLFKYFFLIH